MPLPIAMAHRLVEAPRRRPQGGRRSVPAARRQEPGLDRVRRREARARRHRADQRAAPRGGRRRDAPRARRRRRGDRPGAPRVPRARRERGAGPREPDRPVRDRRAEGRHRPHRAQDHRRHVRRVWRRTAAAPSAARTRRRSTARPPTWRGTSPRTSSPPGSPTGAQLQVAYAIGTAHPVSLMVDTFGTEQVDPAQLQGAHLGRLRLPPRGDHPRPRPRAADLPRDRRLRPLRAQGVPLGGDRPRRRAPRRVSPEVLAGPVAVCVDRPILLASTGRSPTTCRPSSAPAWAPSCRCPFHGRAVRGLGARPDRRPPGADAGREEGRVARARSSTRSMLGARALGERAVRGAARPPCSAGSRRPASPRRRAWIGAMPGVRSQRPPPAPAVLESYRGGPELLAARRAAAASGPPSCVPPPRTRSPRRSRSWRPRSPPGDARSWWCPRRRRCRRPRRRSSRPSGTVPRSTSADRSAPATGCGSTSRRAGSTWWWGRVRPCSRRVPGLGAIVVSRESHPAHREDRAPYYHVRDVALARGATGRPRCRAERDLSFLGRRRPSRCPR